MARHDVLCSLLTHALACDQTRVVNMNITSGMTGLRQEGDPTSHHSYTHEEPIDPKLGYQVKCAWFQQLYLQALHNFAATLDGVKEGDRPARSHDPVRYTDHGAPRLHSVRNYPFITIGDAQRRMKTGHARPETPGMPHARVTLRCSRRWAYRSAAGVRAPIMSAAPSMGYWPDHSARNQHPNLKERAMGMNRMGSAFALGLVGLLIGAGSANPAQAAARSSSDVPIFDPCGYHTR